VVLRHVVGDHQPRVVADLHSTHSTRGVRRVVVPHKHKHKQQQRSLR
jgi:hypothetical protein